jgi:hypothetical protein
MMAGYAGTPYQAPTASSSRQRQTGMNAGQWGERLAADFKEIGAARDQITHAFDIYERLRDHGPIVTAMDYKDFAHAVIVTGVTGNSVLVNNPENDFLSSYGRNFEMIEEGITSRYGGPSFEQWRHAKHPPPSPPRLVSTITLPHLAPTGITAQTVATPTATTSFTDLKAYIEETEKTLQFRKNRLLTFQQFRDALPGSTDRFGLLYVLK